MRQTWFPIMLFMISGCAMIDKGARPADLPDVVKLGIYVESGIALKQAAGVADSVVNEFKRHGVDLRVVWLMPFTRRGHTIEDILAGARRLPRRNADKVLCMIKPTAEDYFMANFAYQNLGVCHIDRDVAVAIIGAVAPFMSGSYVAVHETYHLLGWDHY